MKELEEKARKIAEKYVYGKHDALTDNQEIKDMTNDILELLINTKLSLQSINITNENKPMAAEEFLKPLYFITPLEDSNKRYYLREDLIKAFNKFASQTPKVSDEEIRKMAMQYANNVDPKNLTLEKKADSFHGFIQGFNKGLSMKHSDAVKEDKAFYPLTVCTSDHIWQFSESTGYNRCVKCGFETN